MAYRLRLTHPWSDEPIYSDGVYDLERARKLTALICRHILPSSVAVLVSRNLGPAQRRRKKLTDMLSPRGKALDRELRLHRSAGDGRHTDLCRFAC